MFMFMLVSKLFSFTACLSFWPNFHLLIYCVNTVKPHHLIPQLTFKKLILFLKFKSLYSLVCRPLVFPSVLIKSCFCFAIREKRLFCSIKHKKMSVIHWGQIKLKLMTHPNGLLMVEWQQYLLSKTHAFGYKNTGQLKLYTQSKVK